MPHELCLPVYVCVCVRVCNMRKLDMQTNLLVQQIFICLFASYTTFFPAELY